MLLYRIFKLFLSLVFHIRMGRSGCFIGRPFIRVGGAGSSIVIGDRFTAISKFASNSIGVTQRVMIRTVAPGAQIEIGDDVGVSGCSITAAKRIRIGNRVMIGSGTLIVDSDLHDLNSNLELRRTAEQACSKGKCGEIVIGDDVFIGARAILLKGVTVGTGAIVGAGAVVARDVPSGAVVVGNPARVVDRGGRI